MDKHLKISILRQSQAFWKIQATECNGTDFKASAFAMKCFCNEFRYQNMASLAIKRNTWQP